MRLKKNTVADKKIPVEKYEMFRYFSSILETNKVNIDMNTIKMTIQNHL